MGTIGIEWINKYHGLNKDLKNRDNCARGFADTLDGVKLFEFGDDAAFDQDFEQSGIGQPPTGTDQFFADHVDIVYFAGHGGPNSLEFGRSDRDDGYARARDMRLGDQQLEWIVFDACSVLAWSHIDQWYSTFRGLHGMLGFDSNAYDRDDRGQKFARRLNDGERVLRAWRKACEETEGDETQWAVMIADETGTNTINDHWHGKGYVSPDPKNPTIFGYGRGPC